MKSGYETTTVSVDDEPLYPDEHKHSFVFHIEGITKPVIVNGYGKPYEEVMTERTASKHKKAIASMQQYIDWQTQRVADWQPSELIAV